MLKNKCLRGESLSDEEKTEFCTLMKMNEFFTFPTTDCESYLQNLLPEHLKNSLEKSADCLQNISFELNKKNFSTSISNTENAKGKLMNVSKEGKLLFQIRIMHRTSGGRQYRRDDEYFSLYSPLTNSYHDVNGEKTNSKEQRHIDFISCEQAKKVTDLFISKYLTK